MYLLQDKPVAVETLESRIVELRGDAQKCFGDNSVVKIDPLGFLNKTGQHVTHISVALSDTPKPDQIDTFPKSLSLTIYQSEQGDEEYVETRLIPVVLHTPEAII